MPCRLADRALGCYACLVRMMIWFGVVGLIAAGCNDGASFPDGEAACIAPLERECGIIWSDYDAIYEGLIMPRCGSSFCHGEGGPTALNLSERDLAYDALLGTAMTSNPAVLPFDPECSELTKRLASADPQYRMPRGDKVSAEALCSVVHWIAEGAER